LGKSCRWADYQLMQQLFLATTCVALGIAIHALYNRFSPKRIEYEDRSDEHALRQAVTALSKAQKQDLNLRQLPPAANGLRTCPSWFKCETAIEAVENSYKKWRLKNHKHKHVLVSAYNSDSSCGWKLRVDNLIATHAKRVFPNLAQQLRDDDNLILLLLEAPNCATTKALLQHMPSLRGVGYKICIPQADPYHYASMISDASQADTNDTSQVPGMYLQIRQQRLDQWLSVNSQMGLQVAVFFADYECSWSGRPKVHLSPLRDIQRFLRCNYVHREGCLFGLTLSFRAPTISGRYTGPQLDLNDVIGMVKTEAQAQSLLCTLLETVNYGMTFLLFFLQGEQHTAKLNSSQS